MAFDNELCKKNGSGNFEYLLDEEGKLQNYLQEWWKERADKLCAVQKKSFKRVQRFKVVVGKRVAEQNWR